MISGNITAVKTRSITGGSQCFYVLGSDDSGGFYPDMNVPVKAYKCENISIQ